MEALLGADPPMPQGVLQRLKGWYKATVDRAPPPTRATLERITAELFDLYIYVPSPGTNITVTVRPVSADDSVPTEDEIEEAVNNLRRNRSGGPSGMRTEHLKGWLAVSKQKFERRQRKRKRRRKKRRGDQGICNGRTSWS